MNRLMIALVVSCTVTCLLPTSASADTVTLNLTTPAQSTLPGGTLMYAATIAAPGSNSMPVFLNGENFIFGASATLDDSPFFAHFPGSLAPGLSYTDLIFDLTVPIDVATGTASGTLFLYGGSSENARDLLGSADFSATVVQASAATPEPSTWLLLSTGICVILAFSRLRARPGPPEVAPQSLSLVV